jgi:hypothetical protein
MQRQCPICGKNYNLLEMLRAPDPCFQCERSKADKEDSTSVIQTPSRSPDDLASSAYRRYRNAYLVARATTAIGAAVKFIGVALGLLIVVAAFMWGVQTEKAGQGLTTGLILGAVVAIALYVLGVLVSALGEVLKATLDTSVHGSPFLKREDMARVMSL